MNEGETMRVREHSEKERERKKAIEQSRKLVVAEPEEC